MNSVASRFRSCLVVSGIVCFVLLGNGNAAASHTKAKTTTTVARVGRPFTLRAGRQVTLKGEKLSIKFAAVTQDSRCPSDVTCVWAGNAAVRLDVSTNRKNGKSLTLNTGRSSSLAGEAEYQGYKVKLVDLGPYPRSDYRIAAGDYVVTLLVTKE